MAKKERLLKKAQEHLDVSEVVECAVLGSYETKRFGQDSLRSGILIATNKKIIFYGNKLFGFEIDSFTYKKVSSIETKKGFTGYSISFSMSGNDSKMKYINNEQDMNMFVNFVRKKIEGEDTEGKKVDNVDSLDQIKKLHELKESGIITEEEFEKKKKKLLED